MQKCCNFFPHFECSMAWLKMTAISADTTVTPPPPVWVVHWSVWSCSSSIWLLNGPVCRNWGFSQSWSLLQSNWFASLHDPVKYMKKIKTGFNGVICSTAFLLGVAASNHSWGRKGGTPAHGWLGIVHATGPDPFRHCSCPTPTCITCPSARSLMQASLTTCCAYSFEGSNVFSKDICSEERGCKSKEKFSAWVSANQSKA